jgi:uncharacterized protein (TIGR02145 family)
MKKLPKTWIVFIAIIGVILILTNSCKKEENTPTPQTLTDIDGNVYHTVTIGTQVWMVENLKTTKYNDGTPIPQVTNDTAWGNLITPGYCWYYNDGVTYKNLYGALYNWYAVNTGKLAPTGWHVPTDAEWTTLITYLGGDSVAGGKMKETTSLWMTPNTGATNSSGFSALPGGYRYYFNGTFFLYFYCGNWWSSSEYYDNFAWYRTMDCNTANATQGSDSKANGFSVRCVKN